MEKGEQPIIIKRIKKVTHGGHHGGAWKVAYADFVTAMMAFFLVLWLIAVLSIETRSAIASYFRSFTIYEGQEAGGSKGVSLTKGGAIKVIKEAGGMRMGPRSQKADLVQSLTKVVEDRLKSVENQVLIYTTIDGVRIELIDTDGNPMFRVGGHGLLENGRETLGVIAEVLKDVGGRIVIEGHTDSLKYTNKDYTNWELAADRANAARRELIKNGILEKSIVQVTSYADAVPLDPKNPRSGMNRRVSLLVKTKN